jgi:hypothetical protein
VPSFRVNGLADTPDGSQRFERVVLDVIFSESTEQSDGGRGVELGDLVFVDGVPV